MKRHSRSLSAVVGGGVACLALCALVASCGDDDSSATSSVAGTTAAANAQAATTAPTTTVTTATGSTSAPTTSGATSGACADREALRKDVAALANVDIVAQGTNGITTAIDAVKADLEKVKASAGSNLKPQVQAVQDAVAATETGLQNLGQGGAAQLTTALTSLSTATTALLTTLSGGACG